MSKVPEMIEAMLGMVDRFNKDIIGLPIPATGARLDEGRKAWASTALQEEVDEFKSAQTLEDEVDALLDLTYFALGRIVEMGVAPLPVFEQVHHANMQKQRGELSKRPFAKGFDAVKPEGWRPPDLQPFLQVDWRELMLLATEAAVERRRKAMQGQEFTGVSEENDFAEAIARNECCGGRCHG